MAVNRENHATIVPISIHYTDQPWEQADGAQYFSANPALRDNGDMTLVLIPLVSVYWQEHNHAIGQNTGKSQPS
jgi:hypothetical protein